MTAQGFCELNQVGKGGIFPDHDESLVTGGDETHMDLARCIRPGCNSRDKQDAPDEDKSRRVQAILDVVL